MQKLLGKAKISVKEVPNANNSFQKETCIAFVRIKTLY